MLLERWGTTACLGANGVGYNAGMLAVEVPDVPRVSKDSDGAQRLREILRGRFHTEVSWSDLSRDHRQRWSFAQSVGRRIRIMYATLSLVMAANNHGPRSRDCAKAQKTHREQIGLTVPAQYRMKFFPSNIVSKPRVILMGFIIMTIYITVRNSINGN